jgi:hypothetical protein
MAAVPPPRRDGGALLLGGASRRIAAILRGGPGQGDAPAAAQVAAVRSTLTDEDRIDRIRLDTRYGSLRSIYHGVETDFPQYPGLRRITTVSRTNQTLQTGVLDYYTITVRVEGNGLRAPVARTIVVGAP